MAAQVPNIFVEQYDQGQKKIRADLMDENFAYVCQQLDANADAGSAAQTAADAAQTAADAAQATADGKASPDLDNVTPAGTEVIAHAAMPSSQTVTLSLPQTGGTFTAPADGYVVFSMTSAASATDNQYIGLMGRLSIRVRVRIGVVNSIFLPVVANEVVGVLYTAGMTLHSFEFVYANGSAPTN